MPHTEYSWMTTEEIIEFTEFRAGGSTPLERELALRLSAALAALHAGASLERPNYLGISHGADTGRPG